MALRWASDLDALTSVPIVGARSVEQLNENVGAVDLTLAADQYDGIARAGATED